MASSAGSVSSVELAPWIKTDKGGDPGSSPYSLITNYSLSTHLNHSRALWLPARFFTSLCLHFLVLYSSMHQKRLCPFGKLNDISTETVSSSVFSHVLWSNQIVGNCSRTCSVSHLHSFVLVIPLERVHLMSACGNPTHCLGFNKNSSFPQGHSTPSLGSHVSIFFHRRLYVSEHSQQSTFC